MNWLRRKLYRTEYECCGERLSAYIDRQLTPKELAALERHLAECEDCRWNLETLRQTVEWTRNSAPVRVPRVFTIPVEAAAPRAVRARRPAWGLPLLQGATALVALLFVLVVAGDFYLQRTAPRSAPQALVTQAVAGIAQAPAGQEMEATQVAEVAATVVVEEVQAVMALPPSEVTAAPLLAALPAPVPSASEEPLMIEPTAAPAAEVGGMGKQVPAVSVTMEVMVVVVEPPSTSPKVGATPTVTLTLAVTAGETLLVQPLTVTVTAVPTVCPTATAVPTQQLLSLPPASPTSEIVVSVPMVAATAVPAAERDTQPTTVVEGEYSAAAPTEAPAALLASSAPTEVPVAPPPSSAPTVIAAAPEARDMGPGAGPDEERGSVGTLRESVEPWLGLAEIVLGGVFVLLALATVVIMLRWQPR